MNNSIKNLIKIIIAINIIFCVGCASQNSEYPPPGRDTIEIFGDGRYEICSTTSPFGNYKQYDLYDRKGVGEQIEGIILIYKQYENEKCVYVIGLVGKEGQYEEFEKDILTLKKMPEKIVYTKINYENGGLWQSEELSDFSDKDKIVFEELLNEKTLFE